MAGPGRVGWGVLSVALIASLYVPMLSARFDFADDGNLVYPTPPMALADRVQLTWAKVVANYDHLGPFRPVLWTHWELQAELLGANELRWRLWRLIWMVLAVAAFLWLLRELDFGPGVAACTAALAFWSPAPNEVWHSLTLSEGVAMPYAFGTLICAVRGARSRRHAWAWDVAGMACTLAALGCKNTFAAIIPAQVLLRLAPDGQPLARAIRDRGRRAAVLALPLLLPMVHYVVFRLGWHPGQYESGLPSGTQLRRMLHTVGAGFSLPFIAPALVVGLAVLAAERTGAETPDRGLRRRVQPLGSAVRELWRRHRAACRAGVALLLCGVGVYLPVQVTGPRYAIPAVWGAYLFVAALLTEVTRARAQRRARAVFLLFAAALAVVAVDNLLRQNRLIARSAVLWDALEFVERESPVGTAIAWRDGPDLAISEGIHFYWHLHGRGRADLGMQLLDGDGREQRRPEVPPATTAPTLLVTGRPLSNDRVGWTLQREFTRTYRWGFRQHACAVWLGSER